MAMADDVCIAALAGAQHGVFTRAQALAAGFRAGQIERHVRARGSGAGCSRALPARGHARVEREPALGGDPVVRSTVGALPHERGRHLATR